MAMQPDVLILDEPTSQLDPIAASEFLETVKKINRELGTTIVISEHRLDAVSYTHLDVYKRQICGWTGWSCPAATPPSGR